MYVGSWYELSGSTTRKYYAFAGMRVAMRDNAGYYFLLTDHLGSTPVTATSAGAKSAELRYKAGGNRYTYGTTPTTFHFTGQREETAIGLYFYSARWCDPGLGRFAQADTIAPEPGEPPMRHR